jgi:hypothetical protein
MTWLRHWTLPQVAQTRSHKDAPAEREEGRA